MELFTSEQFILEEDNKVNLKLIRSELERLIENVKTEHIHFIAAKTINLEKSGKIVIGPVTIYSIDDWLEIVDFSPWAKDNYGNKEDNYHWKESLKCKLNDNSHNIKGFAKEIYDVLEGANAVVKVAVRGFEQDLSKKMSKILAKTALDMISLYLGGEKGFFQQVILDERVGPNVTYTLMEFDGYLGGPGTSLEKNIHPIFFEENEHLEFRNALNDFIPNFEYVLDGFTSKEKCKYPNLAHKWIYALIWYAEGIRESNDAIAVAKLASCLDTLSNGSKYAGIKKLLSNMLGLKDENFIFKGEPSQSITLHDFVKKFYEDGRSRILHGTIEDMLESFVLDKKRLINCARLVLLESLSRLNHYEGEDTGKAFQLMK